MDTCTAFNEPESGTCLVRCAREEGHTGKHEGTYRIRGDGVALLRTWTETSPQHRDHDAARAWVA